MLIFASQEKKFPTGRLRTRESLRTVLKEEKPEYTEQIYSIMLTQFINLLFSLSPNAQVAILRRWYEFISLLDKDDQMLFMNYGYVSLDSDHQPPELLPQDEANRYFIQLYHLHNDATKTFFPFSFLLL